MPLASLLLDRSRPPEPKALHVCLGRAQPVWRDLVSHVRELSPYIKEVWTFAGPKVGWSLRLVQKDRVLLYLTPGQDCFRAGLVLGKNAVAASRGTLSASAASIIDAAPVYAEGHGVRIQVESTAEAGVVRELLGVKVGAPPSSTPRRPRA